MKIGFCDRCGIQLKKYHRLRIILDGGDWDNEFELCDDCYEHWLEKLGNREFIEATWNPIPKLIVHRNKEK